MSSVKDWKVAVLSKLFAEVQGMEKVIAITLLPAMGIGQLVLLKSVLVDKVAIKNLLMVIKTVNTAGDLAPLEASIKGKGFTQSASLVNFTSQLKDDKRIMLESLLADEKVGRELLEKGISGLLDEYLYVR